MTRRLLAIAMLKTFATFAALAHSAAAQSPVVDATIRVRTSLPPANRFDPRSTFGGGIDGHGKGAVNDIFTTANIAAMKETGLHMATYRLRTELNIRAWHWNPRGEWSDPAHQQGYWTSDDRPGPPITLSWGYHLPRRGTTDVYEELNYSRLTDGDTSSFWKSNPYLSQRYTGTVDSLLPQWVIVDLGAPTPVNAMRIHWGAPHARAFRVQYWRGDEVHDIDENPDGRWFTFPKGTERDGRGGVELRSLSDSLMTARFVRLILLESAGNAAAGTRDVRDSLGFAIRELEIGTLQQGHFRDVLRHGTLSSKQNTTYASSTDPWHRELDKDAWLEQPGLDRFFTSSVTFNRPAMVPVAVLYGTPEDAAAEIRYLRRRGYKIGRIEMGEEPDGQWVTPEDYGALYAQVARRIRAEWPQAKLGGPGFMGLESRVMFGWPNDTAGASWIPRFLKTMRERARPGDFSFFSFEWYPWDRICNDPAPQLAEASARLVDRLTRVATEDSLDPKIPRIITEYGYSAFPGESQVSIVGALLNADIVGRFLILGGREAYLYGWEPTLLDKNASCDSWGNNMLFLSDSSRRIVAKVATYHGLQMMMHDWLQPRGEHLMFRSESTVRDSAGNELVSAYVVKRPDGAYTALVVNKDAQRSYRVSLSFDGPAAPGTRAPSTAVLFGPAQYEWRADAERGRPVRSDPPQRTTLAAGQALELPPYAMAVLTIPTAVTKRPKAEEATRR